MPSSETYEDLQHIALTEFADIVTVAMIVRLDSGVPRKLRLHLIDGSYADVFVSSSGRYSYYWEQTADNAQVVYRHDNAPHTVWKHVATYSKHFHSRSEDKVVESYISSEPGQAIREFCRFIRDVLRTGTGG